MGSERWFSMLAAGRDSPLLRFSLGSDLFQEGRYSEAIVHLKAATEGDARFSAAWKMLGTALTADGETEAAMRAYQSGIAVAMERGDKQAAKEMAVFLKRLERDHAKGSAGPPG